jgi:type IV fimbrial biogenesis protein FimT
MNNKRSAARRPGGYTLVELMLGVAIAATLASVALPSLGAFVQNNRRAAVVNELVATLLFARSEAIKRGEPVIVCGFHDTNRNGMLDPPEQTCGGRSWSEGWFSASWSDHDQDRTVDAGELREGTVRYYLNGSRGVKIATGNFLATPPVKPAGTAVIEPFLSRSSNGTITVCDSRGSAAARAVIIPPNGRPRVSGRKSSGAALDCPAT